MKPITTLLCMSTSLFTLAAPAFAQTDGAQTQPTASGVEEIVVTAQRREESAQRTALSLQVLSGNDLESAGVSQVSNLTALVPGLQIAQIGGTAQPYIRGVGNASNTGQAVSGVAFNVDGVYVGQVIAYGFDFFDLQRAEVLKGPQGTLYGRNATGGAVNLITNLPGDTLGGYATLDVGNYDLHRLSGAVDLPVNDDLAFRLAFNTIRHDGYFDDGSGDEAVDAVRLRTRWNPSERVHALFNLEYAHQGGVGGGAAVLDATPSAGSEYRLVNTWSGPHAAENASYVGSRDTSEDAYIDTKVYMASAQIDVDLGGDTVWTTLPAYRRVTHDSTNYVPLFRITNLDFEYKQSSLESRIAHDGADWKWVAGAYYFNQDQNTPYRVDTVTFPDGSFGPGIGTAVQLTVDPTEQTTESTAVFGEATYSVTDQFRLTAGLRYTTEDTDGNFVQTFTEKPLSGECTDLTPCVVQNQASVSSENTSYKVGFEYDVAPQSMLFVTYATGYKAGGVSPTAAPRDVYRPEKLEAFTIGLRNRFLQSRMQLNLEGFYWEYTDKQETISGYDGCGSPLCGGTISNLTVNAGGATLYGGVIDFLYRITDADTVHLAAEYNHTELKDFALESATSNFGCSVTSISALPPLNRIDCSGRPLSRAPLWTVNADYGHEFILPNSGNIAFNAALHHASSRYLDVHYLEALKAPAYTTGDVDLAYNAPGDRWSVTAYVRNVSDEAVGISAYSLADSGVSPDVSSVVLAPPRTYGVRFSVEF